jgi:MoxR-like ATPase
MYKERVKKLISLISGGLHEREEIVSNSLLAILAGQSIFLYGLPGTAKSLIARRLSKAFKKSTHFEYLMQRFSTPEEVFGPVSIHELKQDRFLRKTKGYLPTADFAFLDEIWKSSPAILNTLLTIINERVFRNGDTEERVPLKGLIAASNETPPPNQGLEALYDRFTMRIMVEPMKERSNFEALIDGKPVLAEIDISDEIAFNHEEWESIPKNVSEVNLSKETLEIIHSIRLEIEKYNKNNPEKSVYVSDRRWQKIAIILKTASYLCDRKEVIPVDTLILRNCLWTLESNKDDIEEIVETAIKSYGKNNVEELGKWLIEYRDLDNGINETFFYTEDVYDTEVINGKDCFSCSIENQRGYYNSQKIKIRLYIPAEFLGTSKKFHPISENGAVDQRIQCHFNSGKTCSVTIDQEVQQYGWDSGRKNGQYVEHSKFSPPIKIKKDTQKPADPRTKKAFVADCEELIKSISKLINDSKSYLGSLIKKNDTPFVSEVKQKIVTNSIESFIADLVNHKLNAEHLLEKVNSYAVTK